jgi:hypothetical protein
MARLVLLVARLLLPLGRMPTLAGLPALEAVRVVLGTTRERRLLLLLHLAALGSLGLLAHGLGLSSSAITTNGLLVNATDRHWNSPG